MASPGPSRCKSALFSEPLLGISPHSFLYHFFYSLKSLVNAGYPSLNFFRDAHMFRYDLLHLLRLSPLFATNRNRVGIIIRMVKMHFLTFFCYFQSPSIAAPDQELLEELLELLSLQ
jgi:hypothetical protein